MKLAAVVLTVILGTLGLNSLQIQQLLATRTHPPDLLPHTTQPAANPNSVDEGFVRVPGQVQPKTKVTISATVSLPVVELPFKEGDRVAKRGVEGGAPAPGSILARLEDGILKASLRAAEAKRDAQAAEIEVARVRLTALESQIASSRVCVGETERNWERYKKLINTESASHTEIDEAHCKYDRAKAELDAATRGYAASRASLEVLERSLRAAEAEVDKTRLDLAAATITSPIDGTVTRVNVKVGEVVNGTITNPGTVLMEVADMDRMLLVARVDEESISKLKVGQKATVHLKGYDDQTFTGRVDNVALTSTEQKDGTCYFKTEISLDTRGRRIPAGLSGEARIKCLGQDSHF